MSQKADKLKSKTSLPLIVAPMFLVSTPEMVIEACKKGVVGSFPALNQRTSAGFEQWLTQINNALDDFKVKNPGATVAPYAVNLIVHNTNARLQDDLALCVKHKVPVVITSLGAVPQVVQAVQSYGGIVLHDVTNVAHARKAAQAGVDGIIAVAAGAGGHGGTMNPVALSAAIREFFDGILVLSGTLTTGADILAAQAMDADFAYMGTRFINTKESGADAAYKQMVCDSSAADVVYTSAISGIPANFLRQSLEKAGYDVSKLSSTIDPQKLKGMSTAKEAKAWKDVWSAGQGVGGIKDIPTVAQLIDRLAAEYDKARGDFVKKITPAQKPPQP